jgi:RNA polymerase sigma-70 factor (ECF subfamily)
MTRISDERALWLARHVLPHEPALRAWLRNRHIAGLEIDDVIQETYARLIMAESVTGVRNPKTYAFQAAYSVLMTHLRRSKVVSFQAVSDIEQLGASADDPSPEQQVVDRDELRRLAEAIAGLPDRVGEVFTLRRIQGMSQREVAQRLGISESTVEKHMSRGLYLLTAAFNRSGNPVADASKRKKEEMRAGRVQSDSPGD